MHEMGHDEYLDFMREGTRTAKLATVRTDGRPHVAPVWFVMDGDDVIFATTEDSVEGRTLVRDDRAAISVDDQEPPFSFAMVEGNVSLGEAPEDMLQWTARVGSRYMGEDRAEEFGRRNAAPGWLLVRLRPEKIVAFADMAA